MAAAVESPEPSCCRLLLEHRIRQPTLNWILDSLDSCARGIADEQVHATDLLV